MGGGWEGVFLASNFGGISSTRKIFRKGKKQTNAQTNREIELEREKKKTWGERENGGQGFR